MAEGSSSSGSGNTLLAVIVGALLVGIAFFFAVGGFSTNGPNDEGGVTILDDDPDVNLQIGGESGSGSGEPAGNANN